MKFRTEIEPIKANFQVDLSDKILTIGSCFSEVIGQRLSDNKLTCSSNPFGTVFNPYSISKLLRLAMEKEQISENLFLQNTDGTWFHHDFHSQFWANSKTELHEKIQTKTSEIGSFLQETNILIITFGTALVYQHSTQVVSNCHKVAASNFERKLLSIKDICRNFSSLYQDLKQLNPQLNILLTVSPVRHTKDTLPLNSTSKAMLRGACHYLENDLENVHYFPAYEIMLDDLRDYRFYQPDLIHPNEMAEKYIFDAFSESYFSENLKTFIEKWQKIKQGLAHRPQQIGTASHGKFKNDLKKKLEEISSWVDVSEEMNRINL